MMDRKNKNHYYVEPVEIEIYLKKAGKVRTIIRDLYIELIDVKPINENSKAIFDHFHAKNEPIDLMEVQNQFPQFIKVIYDSYYQNMDLFEKLSIHFKAGLSGSKNAWKQALNFSELLIKYEPTIASSKFIGDFQTYNLNYLVIKLNELKVPFLLEDNIVAYLIKRKRSADEGKPVNREFEKLVELWEYNIKDKIF